MSFKAATLEGCAVALYGRFLTAPRAAYLAAVSAAGGRISRDLTRGTDLFVVGLGAGAMAAKGALDERLAAARARHIPIYGEERLRARLSGETVAAHLPLSTALKDGPLPAEAIGMLAAFDVIRLDGQGADERCRFEDAESLRQAADLLAQGISAFEAVKTFRRARSAPPGRRKVVALGETMALAWDDGAELTGLDGQRLLPLDLETTVEDAFDEAVDAEADGDAEEAARLYAVCVKADRKDPIAPYNLANLQMRAGALQEAVVSYHLAVARDPRFVEAHYNLAAAYEAAREPAKAEATLEAALKIDPGYGDALFNLAQLKLARGAYEAAQRLFEAYLAQDPPTEWAATARKALTVIRAAGQP